MHTMKHLITTGVATVAVLAGTAVAATAQSDKIIDKRADVVQYDGYGDDSGTILDRADSIASGVDATSAAVKYGKKSMRVTMRFANLTSGNVQVYGAIRVKGSKSWPTYQIISGRSKNRIMVYNRNYSKMLCTGKMTRKNGDRGSISYVIANSCFKKPKAIKVQTGIYGFDGDPTLADVTIFDESISSTKTRSTSSTKWLKAG